MLGWFAVSAVSGATPGKELHDSYGAPNVRTSEHFAVWWGDEGDVATEHIDHVLDGFELAWSAQVDRLGYPAPSRTDREYFNVYVGGTGPGTPEAPRRNGYFTHDAAGRLLIVLAAAVTADPADAAEISSHEFFHAIQFRFGAPVSPDASWYWEATAEWAAVATDPHNPFNGRFVASYLLLPRLPVNAHFAPDGGLRADHAYGAFLFPLHLSEQFGVDLVRDSWLAIGIEDEPDPIEVLRSLIAERGSDLDELWLDHLARNVAYDHDAGDHYRELVEAAAEAPEAAEIVARVRGGGGSGAVRGELAPRRYGSATIRLDHPDAGDLEVRVTGQVLGTAGSPARYGARVVRVALDGSVEVHPVPFDGIHGALTLPGVGGDARILLTVGAWTAESQPDGWLEETFDFAWSLDVTEPAGCGCGWGSRGGACAGWVLIWLATRRRPTYAAPPDRPAEDAP